MVQTPRTAIGPRFHPARFFAAALVAMACAAPAASAAQWRKLATPRFTIITHASDGLTREVATDLDDFIGFLGHVVPVDSRGLTPLTIVLFADDGEFTPFKPLAADGRTIDDVPQEWDVWTGSQAGYNDGWAVINMAAQNYNELTIYELFTGGASLYMAGMQIKAPDAVFRGTVLVLSAFKRGITHGELGGAIPAYVHILDHWPLMPVKQFLAMKEGEAIAGHNRVLFDAESWAFVHYLMFAKGPMERHAFSAYWLALNDGLPPQEALVKALGPEGAASIDIDLNTYIHGTRYVLKVPIGGKVENRDPIVPADPMEVEIALAKAALIGRPGSAPAHAAAAVAAANGRPEAYDILAEALAALKAPPADCEKAVNDALARGSRSAWTAWKGATCRFRRIGNPGASPQEARAVVNLAERAANLDLRFRPAFDLLARALVFSDHATDDDAKFLAFARSHFPSDRWILIGQSAIRSKRGDPDGAGKLRELALSQGGGLDASQLAEVQAFASNQGAAGPSAGGRHP